MIVLKRGGLYRLECGAIAKWADENTSSYHCRLEMVDWSSVDMRSGPSQPAYYGQSRPIATHWFRPYQCWGYHENGRVNCNQPGHPLNVKEEILP